jgi:arylsulfatase A-like enzyme
MKRREFLSTILSAAAVGATGFSRRSGPRRPDVILISVDTLRPDCLGCYGYRRETSPAMDALASQGIRFAQTYAQSSWTLPSHMSLFTSQYSHVHAVQNDGVSLRDSAVTLAEVLSGAGYHTTAFVSWVYVAKKFGFDQGFAEFTELLPPEHLVDSSSRWSAKAEQVTDVVIRWLQSKPQRPFFLFVHYFDPHIDYEPPPPFDTMFDPDYSGEASGSFGWLERYIKGLHQVPNVIDPRDLEHVKALYDGEVRYTDTHLKRLFAAIEDTVGLDDSLLILTSDHGEEFNEHGSMEGHQWTLYDEVIRVPLVFRLPRDSRDSRLVESQVELIDVPATIVDYLELPAPPSFQGRSLARALTGKPPATGKRMAFAETRRFNMKQSLRGERYKLIHTDDTGINRRGVPIVPGYELYDLQQDPGEQKNIYDESLPLAKVLVAQLENMRRAQPGVADAGQEGPAVELSDEERERLRAMGYIQ